MRTPRRERPQGVAVICLPLLVTLVLSPRPSEAQEHRVTQIGDPATCFGQPLGKPDDLRVLLRAYRSKPDLSTVLSAAGWRGDLEDLDRAAASAEVVSIQVPPGTRVPFMAWRTNGKALALTDVLWGGRRPIDAYAIEFSSACVRYRLVHQRPAGTCG